MFADKRFEYDSYGQLVRKLSGHGPAKALVLEYDDWNRLKSGVTKARLGVGLARIDQRASAANDANARDAVYYFHNGLSGLPEELTDADGELGWQARYKVWGNAVQEEWIARKPQSLCQHGGRRRKRPRHLFRCLGRRPALSGTVSKS
ncbi:RHS domain-containing protein [Burkholderia ambifaria]|uniref:RHS domain-containing protein n=1 Tax=Burkholderia ambifaria TaxID=152480 RepID=UPI001FC7F563|nr:RHS domain-containing protein [Burkholderia ambifaria]